MMIWFFILNFVMSSGSGAIVLDVPRVVVSRLDFGTLVFKIYSVNRLCCHKQAVVVVDDDLVGLENFLMSSGSCSIVIGVF